MLYILEDNESGIKMPIKGRSPTMRHVSRTYRVALDWLFDRTNVDPKIQIKYVDTKHQLADILTKGNFTRDEWNNLLYLFNISHFSSLLRSEFQLDQLHQNDGEKDARTERRQQDRGKVKAHGNEPGRLCLDKFFSCEQSDFVEKPGVLKASYRTDWSSSRKPDARNSNRDGVSSSEGWQKDALLDGCTGKPVATEENQEQLNYPEEFVGTGKLVAPGHQGYPGTPGTPRNSGHSEDESNDEDWPHHLHISPNDVQHMEKVFSIVR